jgi:threonine dehydrogenase-like Zn-dependent dehydrogenase
MARLASDRPRTTTARATVLTGEGGPFELRELPVPTVRERGALLRMALSGVCATDAHIFKGDWPGFRFPAILGHENCARVEELGPGLETDFLGQPLGPGDLVVPRVASCGRCWHCLVGGAARWCPNRVVAPGPLRGSKRPPSGLEAASGGLALTGGWAELMYLESESLQLFKTTVAPEVAVLTEPMATCVGAIDRAGPHAGRVDPGVRPASGHEVLDPLHPVRCAVPEGRVPQGWRCGVGPERAR